MSNSADIQELSDYDPLRFGDVDLMEDSYAAAPMSPPALQQSNEAAAQAAQAATGSMYASDTQSFHSATSASIMASSTTSLVPAAAAPAAAAGGIGAVPPPYPAPAHPPYPAAQDPLSNPGIQAPQQYPNSVQQQQQREQAAYPALYPQIPSAVPLPPLSLPIPFSTLDPPEQLPGATAAAAFAQAAPGSMAAGPGPTYSISVGQPTKVTGTSFITGVDGQYIVYPITSSCTGPAGYPGPELSVRRRFRDVVALAELLQLLYPGHFIPPRPRRNAIKGHRMLPRFLETRRQGLQRYLQRLAQHPAIRRGQALQVFLQQEGELRSSMAWKNLQPSSNGSFLRSTANFFKSMVGKGSTPTARDVVESVHSPRGDVFRYMNEKIAEMQGTLKNAAVTPLEQRLRDEAISMDEIARLLTQLSAKSHALMSRAESRSEALAAVSKALQGLGTYEDSVGYASGRTQVALADGCLRVSKLDSLAAEHSASQLHQVDDYVHYMPGVKAALHHRESTLLTLINLEADCNKRRARLSAISGAPAQFEKKQVLEVEVSQLEGAVAAAQSEYRRVSELNAQELVELRQHMRMDLSAMLREFVLVQVASSQKAEQLWHDTYRSLGP